MKIKGVVLLSLATILFSAVLVEAQAYQPNAYPYSALYVDASQFCTGGFNAVLHTCINSSNSTGSSGNTMWEAISAAIASPLNVSGVIDARAFQGTQIVKSGVGTTALYGCDGTPTCEVGGVPTPTPPGSQVNGVLLLGNVTNYCDGPSSGNYTDGNSNFGTPCIIVPWGFQIIGSTQFIGSTTAGTIFAPCLGSNSPAIGCTTTFPQRSLSINSITVSGTTMTVTPSTTLYTMGGPKAANPQNIYLGELVAITGVGAPVAAYNVLRTVQTFPVSPSNSFTVSVPSGTTTTNCSGGSCGTAYLVTPLIGFGFQNNSGNAPPNGCNVSSTSLQCAYVPVHVGINQSFAARLINLSFDLQDYQGAVAAQNLNGGEQSGMDTIYCVHPSMGCVQVGPGAQESGPYNDIYVQTQSTLSFLTHVSQSTFGIYNGAPGAGFHRFTMTSNINVTSHPTAAIYNDGPNVVFDGEPHNEGTVDTIDVAANSSVYGLKVSGIVGPPSTNLGMNLVHIINSGNSSGNFTVQGSTISAITQQTSGSTNAVADDIHSNNVTDPSLSRYEFDGSGNPVSGATSQTTGFAYPTLNGSGYTGNVTLPGASSGGIPYFTSSSGLLGSSATLAANAIVFGAGTGSAPTTGNADFTYVTHTLTAGPSGLVDFSGMTGSNAFKVPSQSGLTSNGISSVGYDTMNKNTHIPVNGGDALAAGEASAIASNVIPKAANATQALLTSSLITDNGTTATYTGTGGLSAASFSPSQTTNILISGAAPTISSGFGTSPSVTTNNGTAAFTINVGTGGTASTGVIGLPTAANGWNCFAFDTTHPNTGGGFYTKQTAGGPSTATLTGYSSSAQAAWLANDILSVSCFAR